MAIQKLKLPTGGEVIINEWISIPRFSTCEFGSDTDVNLRIFNYIVGSRVPQQGTIPVAFANRIATTTDTNQSTKARGSTRTKHTWCTRSPMSSGDSTTRTFPVALPRVSS